MLLSDAAACCGATSMLGCIARRRVKNQGSRRGLSNTAEDSASFPPSYSVAGSALRGTTRCSVYAATSRGTDGCALDPRDAVVVWVLYERILGCNGDVSV